jgi:hypothetical protein
MHQLGNKAIMLAIICALSGCASITGGTRQHVAVETTSAGQSIAGANCTVSNDRGTQNVTTPGTVTVHRDSSPLDIHCDKDGAPIGGQLTYARVRGMVWGNIVFGGLIGLAIDFGNGAAHHYPNTISVMSNAAASPMSAQGGAPSMTRSEYSYSQPASYNAPSNPQMVGMASLDSRISPAMFNSAQNIASAKQCDRAIRVVMADGQRALFESTCPASAALQIECTGVSCKPMHPEG